MLYPSIDEKTFIKNPSYKDSISDLLGRKISENTIILTSLNRYERKKNIPLALESFAYFIDTQNKQGKPTDDYLLVIAGGYDTRLTENVELH